MSTEPSPQTTNRQTDKIATVGTQGTLRELLELNQKALEQVVPNYLTAERMMKLALLAALKNPDLLLCTRASIIESVMTACQLGLEIGATSGHLVPYNKNFGTRDNPKWGKVAQFIPDYRGLIGQAKRCNAITKGVARIVYKDDDFEVDYGADKIRHIPNLESTNRKPEDILAVWFRVKLPDGDEQFEVMTHAEVNEIRERSKAKASGPWVTDFGEMAKKTCVKRTMKYIPNQSTELQAAIEHDNRLESGSFTNLSPLLDTEEKVVAQITEQTRDRTNALADEIKNQGQSSSQVDEMNNACNEFEPDEKSKFCKGCGFNKADHQAKKAEKQKPAKSEPSAPAQSSEPVEAEVVLPLVTSDALVLDGITFPTNLKSTGTKDRVTFEQYEKLKAQCDRLGVELGAETQRVLGIVPDDLSREAAKVFQQWLEAR